MILQFKVTTPESKKFVRVYEVNEEMNLFRFSNYILNDLGFSPDQMVIFEGYGQDGSIAGEYGLFDMGDGSMDSVTFADLIARGQNVLHYIFDTHSGRYLTISIEGEVPASIKTSYPILVFEAGPVLTQFEKIVEIEEEPVHARKRAMRESVDDDDFDDEDEEDDDLDDEEQDEDSLFEGEEGEEIYGEE